ncbi:phage tail tube protein [Massilia sp. CMS3.1]|uniref:phage tail tube protein n=1 Tax=Massilia sp. CMS3.1 TaxID=3373083 RepID=UPI003EE561AA
MAANTRRIRNTVILVKVATTAGTDAAPTGAADAVLVSEMSITPLELEKIANPAMRGFFGASADLMGAASVKIDITVALAGSGTAATPPAWGKLNLGCAMAEGILTTPARVEYTPISTGLKDLTIYYYDDGVLHKAIGSMGNVSLSAKKGGTPSLKYEFTGVAGAISATPNVAATLTAWKKPVAMIKENVVDMTFGGTYSAGVITAGDVYPSTGLDCNLGNKVEFHSNLSLSEADITDRETTGSTELQLSAAQEVAMLDKVRSGELISVALKVGLITGNSILIYGPAVQLSSPKKVDVQGIRYVGFDLKFTPVVGNDEIRLICL